MTRVVIIGGGAIGSSVAYWLLSNPGFAASVSVLERDPAYRETSSARSAASIRQQFSTPVNIRLSQAGFAFLREAEQRLHVDEPVPIGLVEQGYLFLASAAGRAVLEANGILQRAEGAAVALFEPAALRERFPWLATESIAAGALGLSGEGWFDGYGLLRALRRKAIVLGARYLATDATGFELAGSRIEAARTASGERIAGDVFVNAAGPWAARVAAWAGVDLPVRARRRTVHVFRCAAPSMPATGCPLVIDPSGVWFRPEGGQFIGGVSPPEDDDPDDLPLDPDPTQWEDRVWPALAKRVPAFEALRLTRAWAGYYEMNTFDANGIVGAHPAVANLIFANGFSGHGIQHAPAVGRAVAELIAHGAYRTLDLAPLGFERILRGEPLHELNVV